MRHVRIALVGAGLFALIEAAPACSSSTAEAPHDAGVTGPTTSDRLFEGTLSTSDGGGGVCTFVIHGDGSAEGMVVTTLGATRLTGTGELGRIALGYQPPASCEWIAPVEGACALPGTLTCGDKCCPPEAPFRCAALGNCYRTANAAAAACGSSCRTCGSTPPAGFEDGGVPEVGAEDAGGSLGGVTGTISGDVMKGTFLDANGAVGVFSAQDATTTRITRFCGTFTDTAGAEPGTWNVQLGGGTASGTHHGPLGSGQLAGTVTESAVSLTLPNAGTASGTFADGVITGTWTSGANTGSWSGTEEACLSASGAIPGGGSATGGGATGSTACCRTVNRSGKLLAVCCIDGCNPDGSCRAVE